MERDREREKLDRIEELKKFNKIGGLTICD